MKSFRDELKAVTNRDGEKIFLHHNPWVTHQPSRSIVDTGVDSAFAVPLPDDQLNDLALELFNCEGLEFNSLNGESASADLQVPTFDLPPLTSVSLTQQVGHPHPRIGSCVHAPAQTPDCETIKF